LKYPIIIFFGLILFSCRREEQKNTDTSKLVAMAGNEQLGQDEFKENYLTTGIVKDSGYNAKRSIENWAIESLFYQEALTKLNKEEIQIEKKVEEYKKTLINYIYQTKLIEANLDTNITQEEIQHYYDEHRDNFILKENILKVNYIKVPVKAPALVKIKRLVYSQNPKDKEQLIVLCTQNAENFFMNDSTWLFLEDIKREIPALRDQPDYNLGIGRIVELTDENYYYYLRVKDVKIKNGLSPINFERQNIRKFIINNRKTQLINEYKLLLLEKAKADKTFTIYSK
jgi:hypothetical protein